MHRAIRSLAFALALLVLPSGAVHAHPLAARPSPTGSLGALWQWVASYLPAWTKAGGMMDPNGYTTKSGSSMDPNGAPHNLPAPLPTSDSGGAMDPDG
ncbi:MAG: hypothetical protein ABIS20_11610 [Thermoanaerobaculia bacterium]